MVAIVRQMADREDWMPGAELQATRKELWEVKEWLTAAQQKKSTPLSLHTKTPTAREPTDIPNSPRGEVEVGDEGDKAREEADTGKASSPSRSMRKQVSKVSRQIRWSTSWQEGSGKGLGQFARAGRSTLRYVRDRVGSEIGETDIVVRAVWCFRPRNANHVARVTRFVLDSMG